MSKITLTEKWLKKHGACEEAMVWLKSQTETDPVKLARIAINEGHFDWVNWTIVRKMNKRQKVQYAVFSAELVIDIYSKKYPDDAPKNAIEAAKAYLKRPSKRTKKAAAYAAAYAAYAAAAANAAYVAAYAPNSAYSADSAVYAAAYAVFAVAAAAHSAHVADAAYATKNKIIDYGISILNSKA